jgi:SecD/SecF fusion protein
VLIYERIREEHHLPGARSSRRSIPASTAPSRPSRLATSTMFVAAAILYFLGSGPVRGFAVSLGLGILTTIVTAVTMTRMMIALWYRYARPTRLPI